MHFWCEESDRSKPIIFYNKGGGHPIICNGLIMSFKPTELLSSCCCCFSSAGKFLVESWNTRKWSSACNFPLLFARTYIDKRCHPNVILSNEPSLSLRAITAGCSRRQENWTSTLDGGRKVCMEPWLQKIELRVFPTMWKWRAILTNYEITLNNR